MFSEFIGCTKVCGCRNCANPYGVRAQGHNEIYLETQVRKRRKHVKSAETGRNFIIAWGEEMSNAPWSLMEELLLWGVRFIHRRNGGNNCQKSSRIVQ